MYFLVYLSTATELYSDSELADILATSRRNNTREDVTGLLLYHDGSILQVLEGDRGVVDRLFDRLSSDTRHYGVIKIIDGEVDRRYFDGWSMGFRRLSPREWKDVEGYLPVHSGKVATQTASGTQMQMVTFIRSFVEANLR